MAPRVPLAWLAALVPAAAIAQDPPTWEQLNARTPPAWFADAKFGIFIHWGVSSVPAYCDTSTYSEWYQHWYDTNSHGGLVRKFHDKLYGKDFAYRDFAPQFRAELWDPAEWGDVFKRSGARYVVITSKHHDGFCLWPNEIGSKVRGYPWHAGAVGPKRDLLGELATAVREAGLRYGLYFSFLEWHNPMYDKALPDYVAKQALPQIKDLIARYQPSLLWPDGEWNHPDSTWRSREMLDWLYRSVPNPDEFVVNDRWGKGLRGRVGDFYTTEYGHTGGGGDSYSGKKIFEECRGIGHSFAFNRAENYDVYLSRTECVRTLIDLVSRGGNLLLDIGPDADGTIPLIMVDRLLAMGRWLERNGESIYGTTKSPFRDTPWGRATQKDATLYLHVFDWPEDGRLAVPGLKNLVWSAYLLADQDKKALPRSRDEHGVLQLDLQKCRPDEHATVIALELDGKPAIDTRFLPDASGAVRLVATAAKVEGKALKLESQVDRHASATRWNLGYWSNTEDSATWKSVVLAPGQYDVELEVAIAPGEGGEMMITIADPPFEGQAFGSDSFILCTLDQPTKSWQDYVVRVPLVLKTVGGLLDIRASATRLNGSSLCNLRSLTFRPKGAKAAAAGGVPTTVREQIGAVLKGMERDLESGEHGAVAAVYADDGVLIGPRGNVTGREAIDAYWARFGKAKRWDLEVWETRGGPTLVHQLGRSTLVAERDGVEQVSAVDFALTWRIGEDGAPRIVSDIYWEPSK